MSKTKGDCVVEGMSNKSVLFVLLTRSCKEQLLPTRHQIGLLVKNRSYYCLYSFPQRRGKMLAATFLPLITENKISCYFLQASLKCHLTPAMINERLSYERSEMVILSTPKAFLFKAKVSSSSWYSTVSQL